MTRYPRTNRALATLVVIFLTTSAPLTRAADVVTGGSANVTVDGKPVARSGDSKTPGGKSPTAPIVEGSSTVFINGKPALRVGDRDACGNIVTSGASNVFVNGRPLAIAGSSKSDC
ncbi:MAG: PAAR domain-containing protein [Pseudomonadota bacterium]